MTQKIRSPIIAVLGHVDHGKTSILDSIRGSAVAKKEAGRITQMIGASYISKEIIRKVASEVEDIFRFQLKIPGLLFIDTPGHEAFTTLRERGGSIADFAILVVDITQGFQPQTIESLRILKQYKTPFFIAANKIDLINGWKAQPTLSFLKSIKKQRPNAIQELDIKIYELMGKVSEFGFDSERFDRLTDFSKQVAILPVSAKTKEGLAELLLLIAGISQRFLEKNLSLHVDGPGKGSIIEVKEEKGLGTTIDIILYDGVLKKGDTIAFLTQTGPKTTKVRSLLQPNIASNNPKEKYRYVSEVVAAAGVKISAPGLDDAIPGSPLRSVMDLDKDLREMDDEFRQIIFSHSEDIGVIIKGDSLGSVEAMLRLFKEKEIPVKTAEVGRITKRDIIEAESIKKKDRFLGVVFGFNVLINEDARKTAESLGVKIFWSDVIYKLIEEYEDWITAEKERDKQSILERLTYPAKIRVLPGCCFRATKPAIFGIEVIGGKLRQKVKLMDEDGNILGQVKSIQENKTNVKELEKGKQAAISSEEINFQRQLKENQILYVFIPDDEREEWYKNKGLLPEDDLKILQEIEDILNKSIFKRKFI